MRFFLVSVLAVSIPFLASCSVLNYSSRILGFSIEKFKNEKAGRFSTVFRASKGVCFIKSLDILEKFKATVTHRSFKTGYIVASNFSKSFGCCLASTEVCIFVTEVENNDVKVEIVSNNSLLAREFSAEFFKMFIK
ncbi:MAG: hypothetical protein LBI98_00315 [Endomicrobium sp.]|jgi:hypothetical protein|nr:hypothetical protein [Endomicrobium sp.]